MEMKFKNIEFKKVFSKVGVALISGVLGAYFNINFGIEMLFITSMFLIAGFTLSDLFGLT